MVWIIDTQPVHQSHSVDKDFLHLTFCYPVSLLTDRGSRVELLLHFSNGLTYHWGISEPLDSLKNATSYRSHRESTSAVIDDPPGTVTKNRDENAMLHHVTLRE